MIEDRQLVRMLNDLVLTGNTAVNARRRAAEDRVEIPGEVAPL